MSHSGHTLYKQEEHHAPVSAPTLSSSSGGAAHAAQGAKKQAPLLCFTRKKKGIDGSPNPAVTGILLSPRKKKNVPTSRLPIGFILFQVFTVLTLQLLPEEYEALTKSMLGAPATIHVHPTNRRHYIGIRTERLNNTTTNNTTGC